MKQVFEGDEPVRVSRDQISSVSIKLAAPTLSITKGLFDVWQRARGDAPLPQRAALNIDTLKELMPYVYMIDVLDGGTDFRVRFMGSALVQMVGTDFTGERTSANADHPGVWRAETYRMVAKSGKPYFAAVDLSDFSREFTKTEAAILPVCDAAGHVTMLICASDAYR